VIFTRLHAATDFLWVWKASMSARLGAGGLIKTPATATLSAWFKRMPAGMVIESLLG